MNFWKNQRETVLRKAKGRRVTQREIADSLGYTDKLVGMWETDVSPPDIARVADIARVYMTTVEVVQAQIAKQAAQLAARRARDKKRETAVAK